MENALDFGGYNVKVKKYPKGNIQIKVYNHTFSENQTEQKASVVRLEASSVSLSEKMIKERKSIEESHRRVKNKIYDYARSNDWEYFLTFTFNPEKVDSFNYEECSEKLSKWLNNVKSRKAPDLSYIVVPELHKSGRYHFHGLFSNLGNIALSESGLYTIDGKKIYNLDSYSYGFTTATKIADSWAVSNYICKYITKDLSGHIKGKKHYWSSKNLSVPEEYTFTSNDLIKVGMNQKILEEKSCFSRQVVNQFGTFESKIDIFEFEENILSALL